MLCGMCRKLIECYALFYVYIFLFHLINSQKCIYNLNDSTLVELHLYEANNTINEKLLNLCPKNITRLKIIGINKNSSVNISNNIFQSDYLSNLIELEISVNKLLFTSTYTMTNHISKVTHLRISQSKLSNLPLGIIYGLQSLKFLDLNNNNLNELPFDFLKYSKKLIFLNLSHNSFSLLPVILNLNVNVDVKGNPIKCSCLNSWILKTVNYQGLPNCNLWPPPCEANHSVNMYSESPRNNSLMLGNATHISALAGGRISFTCYLNSSTPSVILWNSPIGNISTLVMGSKTTDIKYTYYAQPIVYPTNIHVINSNNVVSRIDIDNVRGHMSGDWQCIAISAHRTSRSSMFLQVFSSIHEHKIYYWSLFYGYSGMFLLLLMGIIGGTIRYCSETHCLRRPQPSSTYKGKTFLGVIPVPGVDEESYISEHKSNELMYLRNYSLANNKSSFLCSSCNAIYYLETVEEENETNILDNDNFAPLIELAHDDDLEVIYPCQNNLFSKVQKNKVKEDSKLFMNKSNENGRELNMCSTSFDTVPDLEIIFEKLRLRAQLISSSGCSHCSYINKMSDDNFLHYLPRPGSADVKLVVSNEKLAEEYREALAGLAQAVENPDPTHFYERLEEFRTRLCRDVGHGVKVLRSELQDWREKSAKSVACLRNQSSVAAQRVRASLSYGVEQVKDGMRSVVELCGALGNVGQTISVVSVYIDEKDQIRKERVISDFLF